MNGPQKQTTLCSVWDFTSRPHRHQAGLFIFFISIWKDPSIARWMRTLCTELEPLSRPCRHCFVRLRASYRLPRLAKLFVNPRYVLLVFMHPCVLFCGREKTCNASAKCVLSATRWVWIDKRCCFFFFKELLFCLTPFAPFRGVASSAG